MLRRTIGEDDQLMSCRPVAGCNGLLGLASAAASGSTHDWLPAAVALAGLIGMGAILGSSARGRRKGGEGSEENPLQGPGSRHVDDAPAGDEPEEAEAALVSVVGDDLSLETTPNGAGGPQAPTRLSSGAVSLAASGSTGLRSAVWVRETDDGRRPRRTFNQAGAELAFAEAMGWDDWTHGEEPEEGWVRGHRVQWSPDANAGLVVYEEDDEDTPYVLVIGRIPEFEIRGLITVREAREQLEPTEDMRTPERTSRADTTGTAGASDLPPLLDHEAPLVDDDGTQAEKDGEVGRRLRPAMAAVGITSNRELAIRLARSREPDAVQTQRRKVRKLYSQATVRRATAKRLSEVLGTDVDYWPTTRSSRSSR